MTDTVIKTVESLHEYLRRAMQLEHATIPTYLTALYSLHPQTNSDAYHVLRVVLVEEMLHLTIAANLMNATGGKPDLSQPGFVPAFPTYLPDGEKDFQVSLACFSPSTLETFLKIERPSLAPDGERRRVPARSHGASLAACPENPQLEYYSIGEFYEEIERGFEYLYQKLGAGLFSGDPARQIGPQYYYSGGGELKPVVDMESARDSISLIIGQGEGATHGIGDVEKELAHYYRFEQLKLGRYYLQNDTPHNPTGPECKVDWAAVYPTHTNPRLEQFQGNAELHETALAFNRDYAAFLGLLTQAFNGKPELLIDAVPKMFELRNGANLLIRNPLPGSNAKQDSAAAHAHGPAHAAPTFELEASR